MKLVVTWSKNSIFVNNKNTCIKNLFVCIHLNKTNNFIMEIDMSASNLGLRPILDRAIIIRPV